jgi:hypothetical protein
MDRITPLWEGPDYVNFFAYSGHGYRYSYGQVGGARDPPSSIAETLCANDCLS